MFDAEPEQVNQEMIELGRQLDEVRQQSQLSRFAFFPIAADPAQLHHRQFPARRLDAPDLQHVVLVAGRRGARRRLGSSRSTPPSIWFPAWARWPSTAWSIPAAQFPSSGPPARSPRSWAPSWCAFPKTKIQLGFFYWVLRPRLLRFSWPAYAVLPLWFVEQFLSGAIAGETGGVAYWAHIGGFLVGRGSGTESALFGHRTEDGPGHRSQSRLVGRLRAS